MHMLNSGRLLALVAAGALVLLVAAIVTVLVVRPKETTYLAGSPQAVVQRYFKALNARDYAAVRATFSASLAANCTEGRIQAERAERSLEASRVEISNARVTGESAAIDVTIRHEGNGGFLGNSGYTDKEQYRLIREQGAWRMTAESGFGGPWPLHNCNQPPQPAPAKPS